MITLINGFPQGPNGLIVPLGSIKFALNVDGTVIASPGGFVAADIPVVFQFNAAGQIQPNPPAIAAKIWSNEELQPQLSSTLLGTYYLVTFYDQNGAILNATPLWWQFPEVANSTVDISQMTPVSTVGGNVIYYPTNFGGSGTVTSVAFAGDGVLLSATPSSPVTTSGNIGDTLLTQNSNLIFAGPATPGPAAIPTFRFLTAGDVNVAYAAIMAATSGANQSSPDFIISANYWTGSVSAADTWSVSNVMGSGTNPTSTLTIAHSGTSGGKTISIGAALLFMGSLSGSASIQVGSMAGSPNPWQLPATTGTPGQVLSTDGSNPQQLNWITSAIALPFAVDTGIANAYIVAPPGVTATLGQSFNWTTTHPNTSTCTINVNGTGVKNLVNPSGVALTTGNILSGVQYSAVFDGQEWVLGGFGNIAASSVALPGTLTLVSLDPSNGFNQINGAPLTLLAKNPPATRQPLLAFGNAAGTSSAFIGFDNDNVCVFGTMDTRFAFLSGSNPEFFDAVAITNNTSFGNDDLYIQPSLGGLNKTSGSMLNVLSGDGNSQVTFTYQNILALTSVPLAFKSANAATQTIGQSSELLTLSLASTHTDTTGNLLPAGAIIDCVVIYITQTISGGSTPTTIAIGDASTSNRFISTGTPLTAGSTAVGLNQIDAGASSQAAAAKVRVTLDQIPGQGIVRITVFWRAFTAPTS